MLCGIFSVSILGSDHHVQVKNGFFFHLRNCVSSQTVSGFRTFGIGGLGIGDTQPALHLLSPRCVLQGVRHHDVHIPWWEPSLGLPHRQVATHLMTCLQMTVGSDPFTQNSIHHFLPYTGKQGKDRKLLLLRPLLHPNDFWFMAFLILTALSGQ